MKYKQLLCLLPLLGGCSDTAPKKEQVPDAYPQLAWLNKADAEKDSEAAIKSGDFRLLAIPGRGDMVPGVSVEDKSRILDKCSTKLMEGMGDTIRDPEHRKWWQKARDYAQAYNQKMLKHCL